MRCHAWACSHITQPLAAAPAPQVVLKDCVLTLNGRDYLVHKCTGEMDF